MHNFVLLSTSTSGGLGSLFGFVFAVLFIALAFTWFTRFLKKVNGLIPLLTTDPDTYIQETELLLKGYMPNGFKAMLHMNIAVAHMQKNDYPAALSAMSRIKSMRLKKDNAIVYLLNLAHIYVHLGENAKALGIAQSNEKQFQKVPMGGNLPRLNGFVKAFAFMEVGDWEHAQEILEYAKSEWSEVVPGVDFQILFDRFEAHQAAQQEVPQEVPQIEET